MSRLGIHSSALGFAAYTFWLLTFPMKGALLGELASTPLLLSFLVPHILTLFAIGLFRPANVDRLCDAGLGVTMAVTCLFPLIEPRLAGPVMAVTGAASALAMIKAGALLRGARDACLAAAAGLALANVLLLASLQIELAPVVRAGLAAAPLGALLQRASGPRSASPTPPRFEAAPYLPFIFLYYLSSGLRYDVLQANYSPLGIPLGVEVLFYVGAVIATCALLRRRRGLALGLGILAGLLSLAFSFGKGGAMAALNMFAMQASAGFVDVFVVWLLLLGSDPTRSFGFGIAALCLGIAAGESLTAWLGSAREQVAAAGNLSLVGALFVLSLLARSNAARLPGSTAARTLPDSGASPHSPTPEDLPPGPRSRLSPREEDVLRLVLRGLPYKDAASELALSESSIKTYMRRVFEKLDVSDKQALIERYFRQE